MGFGRMFRRFFVGEHFLIPGVRVFSFSASLAGCIMYMLHTDTDKLARTAECIRLPLKHPWYVSICQGRLLWKGIPIQITTKTASYTSSLRNLFRVFGRYLFLSEDRFRTVTRRMSCHYTRTPACSIRGASDLYPAPVL